MGEEATQASRLQPEDAPTINDRLATIIRPMPHPLWSSLAARADLTLTDAQLGLLDAYIDALLAANQTMNLTRIDTRDAAEVGHVGDALTLLPYIPGDARRLADV